MVNSVEPDRIALSDLDLGLQCLPSPVCLKM